MHSEAATIAEYIKELDDSRRPAVKTICDLVKAGSPGVEETMEHKMPFFKLNSESYIAVASQKQYVSLYVVKLDESLEEDAALNDAFSGVNRGKNCLRFRPTQLKDLPKDPIASLIRTTFRKCS